MNLSLAGEHGQATGRPEVAGRKRTAKIRAFARAATLAIRRALGRFAELDLVQAAIEFAAAHQFVVRAEVGDLAGV
jgi:hypothetical protein